MRFTKHSTSNNNHSCQPANKELKIPQTDERESAQKTPNDNSEIWRKKDRNIVFNVPV